MLVDSLEWLGHAGFRLRTGALTVYIDPYRIGAGPPADLILITHAHYDHFSLGDIAKVATADTWLVGPPTVAERCAGRFASIAPGTVLELEPFPGVELAGVAAYNTSKRDEAGRPFHPREAGGVGFDINVRGERLYHAGDTDVVPEMDAVTGVDVALLPVSGTHVMTATEAAEAARRIQPRVAIPMHWGGHVGTRADADLFAARAGVEAAVLDPVG